MCDRSAPSTPLNRSAPILPLASSPRYVPEGPARPFKLIAVCSLIAAPKEIPLGAHSDCIPCPHYKLVIPTLSGTLRLPAGPFSWNATLGAEKIETKITVADMLTAREQQLHHVSARLFVLWDKFSERGWLVGGDTVALHLLRVYAHRNERSKLQKFDFMSLKNLGTDASSAYNTLAELNVLAASEEEGEEVLGPYLNEVYSMLLRLPEQMLELLRTHALSTPFERWYDRHFGTSFFGADFDELTRSSAQPEVYTYKLAKDPGWLKWAKEEKLTFLFASGLGELLEPKAGSCCPCFPTLPTGENFLASELRILKRLITKHAGVESCFPPEKTVARLSRGHGWERRLDPFPSQKCQGDHLNTPGPTCFPVQSTLPAPLLQRTKERRKKDVELLQNKALYTVKDFNDMIDKNPSGVVVFGHQPKPKELKDISRQSRQSSQSDHQQVTATSAQSSGRASSHGSAAGSTTSRTLPEPETARNRAESSSSVSAQRTPSSTSVRSSGSGAHIRPVQGNSVVATRQQESTPRSPATSVRKAASNMSLRSIVSKTRSRASHGGGAGRSQSPASQSSSTSVHRAASGASSRGTESHMHPSASQRVASGNDIDHAKPQAVASPSPVAPARRAASNASLRSIGSNTHAIASHGSATSNITGPGQPQVLSSRSPAPSIHEAASNASLRSTSSASRSIASNGGADRSRGPSAVTNAQIPTRMASNSSIRTTSSAASRATTGSQLQRPSAQASDMGLKKTATNSSDRTTGSQSSRIAQNLEAFNSNRQQQQQQAVAQPTSSNQGTSSGEATKKPHPSSSASAPTAAGGPDLSS